MKVSRVDEGDVSQIFSPSLRPNNTTPIMPPAILSSPLLSVPVLDVLLRNPTLSAKDRIPLLHAKIALLTNRPSGTASTPSSTSGTDPMEDLLEETKVRVEVAKLFTELKQWTQAENELTLVVSRTSPFFKAVRRDRAKRPDQEDQADRSKPPPSGDKETESEFVVRVQGDEGLMSRLRPVRVDALTQLALVEGALGREGRAKRWRDLVAGLEGS